MEHSSYRYSFLDAPLLPETAASRDENGSVEAMPEVLRRLAYRPTVQRYFAEAKKRQAEDANHARRGRVLRERAAKLASLWVEVRDEPGPAHDAVREELIHTIRPMLRQLAVKEQRTTGTKASVSDLEQAAWAEVIKAMPNYDGSKALFASFASSIAAHAMKREAMDHHCQFRIGTCCNDKRAYFFGRRTLREVELTKGPLPQDQLYALAAADLQIPVENLKRVMQAIGDSGFSFDQDRTEGGTQFARPHDHKEMFDRHPLPEEAVDAETNIARLLPALSQALAELTERDRGIISMRLMQPDNENASLSAIGKAFGYSKKHIREIVEKTLARLRTRLEALGVTADDIRDFAPMGRGSHPIVTLSLIEQDHQAG